jgi:hypothetical protein
MYDNFQLEKLHIFLNTALSDDQIMANPRLGTKGIAKVAKHMGIPETEVPNIINALSEKMRNEITEDLDSGGPRFTYEQDSLGGVTVRDNKTGDDRYLDIQSAASLLKALDDGGDTEQDLLAKAMNESVNRELSASEMGIASSSIFNFPWKLNEQQGFAAAEFSGFGSNFKMKIVSTVDADGEPCEVNEKHLLKEARKFIDHV